MTCVLAGVGTEIKNTKWSFKLKIYVFCLFYHQFLFHR